MKLTISSLFCEVTVPTAWSDKLHATYRQWQGL